MSTLELENNILPFKRDEIEILFLSDNVVLPSSYILNITLDKNMITFVLSISHGQSFDLIKDDKLRRLRSSTVIFFRRESKNSTRRFMPLKINLKISYDKYLLSIYVLTTLILYQFVRAIFLFLII